jgi:prevent-host-death family protein
MEEVGLRELRQQASDLVRRAEAGETIVVTVSGRPAAQLSPVGRNTWRRFEDIRALFNGKNDPTWVADRDQIDGSIRDPWEPRVAE